jgi:hypothetical protein
MVNPTTKPLLVNPEIGAERLDAAIRKAIGYAMKNEAEHLGSPDGSPVLRLKPGRRATFSYFMVHELNASHVYGEAFIHAAFELSNVCYFTKTPSAQLIKSLLVGRPNPKICKTNLARFRSGLKTILLHLWHQRILMLPLTFKSGTSIRKSAYNELLTEVALLFWKYEKSRAITTQRHAYVDLWCDTEFEKAHRVVWATNWHSFEDIDIDEVGEFHSAVLHNKSPLHWPFYNMLLELLNQRETQLKFKLDDVKHYGLWLNGRYYRRYSFREFRCNLEAIQKERLIAHYKNSLLNGRKRLARKRERLGDLTGVDFSKPRLIVLLEHSALKNDHDAAIDYFSQAPRLNRTFASTDPYPGRLHIDVGSLSKLWLNTFHGWLKFREHQGYEEPESACASLRILSDYLFLYLPWWCEMFPQNHLKIPASPADFKRFDFLIPSGKDVKESPLSLLEILKYRRRSTAAQGKVVSDLSFYFDYLVGHQHLYRELDEVVLTNPVIMKLDFPKGRKSIPSKTTKVPFTRKVFPYLLRYLYALERFGVHLQQLALQGQLKGFASRLAEAFVPEDHGYSVQFEFNDEAHHIRQVPNVYSIAKRKMRGLNGDIVGVHIPQLAALRTLIVALETGLRIQAVQWLDRSTWDCRNINKPSDTYVYDLFVNTDKTKQTPWIAPIVYRAREVLLREQQFQESIFEKQMESVIPYENRRASRFADVLPLFRAGGRKGNPVNDTRYYIVWQDLLIAFQKFYNEQVSVGAFTPFLEIKPCWIAGIETEGNMRIEYDDEGVPYCPLRYAPISTPHSARATFVSNRSGIVAIEDIAKAVGHASELVTYHYMVEGYEKVVEKIKAADEYLFNYDPENPACVRADLANSALRRSFNKDRNQTEKRFGFASVSLLNEKDEASQDGVELLRSTPMGQVVFRETHICPVGELCPDSIRDLIHEPRRCGLCPLAIKSVDHLPAIGAKMSQLLEQVHAATPLLEKLKKKAEPDPVIEEINDRRRLDVFEYLGWKRSFQVLSENLERSKSENENDYQVDEPELIRRHLQLVCKQNTKTEFVLSRIADVQTFPRMETAELRAGANRLRQQLLANVGRVEEALKEIPEGDEITAFISSLGIVARALGITSHDVFVRGLFEKKPSQSLRPSTTPKLLSSASVNCA